MDFVRASQTLLNLVSLCSFNSWLGISKFFAREQRSFVKTLNFEDTLCFGQKSDAFNPYRSSSPNQ